MIHYIEYDSGYCTMVPAASCAAARRKAGRSRVPGDSIRLVRLATSDDKEWFAGMSGGGVIR